MILTSLPAGAHVQTVFTDPFTGLLAGSLPQQPRIFIETSTIEVSTSLAVRQAVEAASPNFKFLDAPVSGGIPVAAQGKLTIMCGGDERVFEQARSTLELFGKKENLFFCGDAGAGLATKQINNYVAFVSFIGLCEGAFARSQYLITVG
jgi:3-hydroxyisobutyrate/3-hydroxypropionate dehydrogenase